MKLNTGIFYSKRSISPQIVAGLSICVRISFQKRLLIPAIHVIHLASKNVFLNNLCLRNSPESWEVVLFVSEGKHTVPQSLIAPMSQPIGSAGETTLRYKEADIGSAGVNPSSYNPYGQPEANQRVGDRDWVEGVQDPPIGSAGETTPHYTSDPSIGSAGMIPAQPRERGFPGAPPIGSAGETTPHYTTDPSIGTAGMIPGQPRGRDFPDAPPIGSGGAQPNAGWNQNVGTANEGEQPKHGFLYNLFHKK